MASTSNHHSQPGLDRERSKFLFPLKDFSDVVKFFRYHLENAREPDLTLLSIVVGYVENVLASKFLQLRSHGNFGVIPGPGPGTGHSFKSKAHILKYSGEALSEFPVITYDFVNALYKKFQSVLSVVDKPKPGRYASRQIIKKVSDVIWHSLIRSSYKNRAHLQSLYSYLTGNKLDCFGVALAVVAGCQLLGYKDVHLALSEDHYWVAFGKSRIETVEVTWHGKGHEDKRGQDVLAGYESRSWLYLAGNPVICDRYMEVAAIVAAINPSLTITEDCIEVAELQQRLLWLLYDLDHLEKYPQALMNLGQLEEVSPTEGRPTCEDIYSESIRIAQKYYKNHHVYPHTYLGLYYYRQQMYREAFASWANAADVIRLYIYSRDDEEVYKDFLNIANDFIPIIMKTESSGHSARSILRDAQCFANLLRFYDGICQWEEGSLTPILHIGWARPLVNTISKFDYDIRSKVVIICAKDENDISAVKKNATNELQRHHKKPTAKRFENSDKVSIEEGNNNNCIKKERHNNRDVEGGQNNKQQVPEIPSLAALTAACGEKILNPEFLLQGGGEPFAESKRIQLSSTFTKRRSNPFIIKSDFDDSSSTIMSESKFFDGISLNLYDDDDEIPNTDLISDDDIFECKPKRPIITLYSQKMKGLSDLFVAEKLNTHAISLQVTAQSQVAAKKIRGGEKSTALHTLTETNCRPKRSRRDHQ